MDLVSTINISFISRHPFRLHPKEEGWKEITGDFFIIVPLGINVGVSDWLGSDYDFGGRRNLSGLGLFTLCWLPFRIFVDGLERSVWLWAVVFVGSESVWCDWRQMARNPIGWCLNEWDMYDFLFFLVMCRDLIPLVLGICLGIWFWGICLALGSLHTYMDYDYRSLHGYCFDV